MCKSTRQAVIASVHHFIDKANDIYNLSMVYPTIKFAVKGRKGGTCESPKWELDFNEGLLEDNLPEYINQVAPHEVAHLVCYKLQGNQFEYKRTRGGMKRVSHGEQFYKVMRVFGVKEERCHKMDTSKVAAPRRTRNAKKFKIMCSTCASIMTVGTIRANKINNGAQYIHSCGGGRKGVVKLV